MWMSVWIVSGTELWFQVMFQWQNNDHGGSQRDSYSPLYHPRHSASHSNYSLCFWRIPRTASAPRTNHQWNLMAYLVNTKQLRFLMQNVLTIKSPHIKVAIEIFITVSNDNVMLIAHSDEPTESSTQSTSEKALMCRLSTNCSAPNGRQTKSGTC